MVSISSERINRSSPYKVADAKLDYFVKFTTDFGVDYLAGFEPTDLFNSCESYQFVIINVNNKKSPRDTKLRDTIMSIVYDFFLSSNTAMLYICDTGDKRQSMRDRLFQYWVAQSKRLNEFKIMSSTVRDDEGMVNFVTIILRIDHPKRREVIEEFTATVNLLEEKPDATN